MSLSFFFHYPLSSGTPGSSPVASAWHAQQKLLVVASTDGEINVFDEEGERIEKFSCRRPTGNALVTSIDWHPTKVMFCAGYSDGLVALWTDVERKLVEGGSKHSSSITFARWSPEGRRILSADLEGTLCVWKVDSRGAMSQMWKYKTAKSAITKLAFRITTGLSNIECPPFFFGGEAGTVYFADDMNHCTQIFSMQQPLAALLYMESRQAVVGISKNAVMSVFRHDVSKISPGTASTSAVGSFAQVMRVKISAAAEGVADATWLAPGVLAYISHDALVRIWDLHHEENYAIKPLSLASAADSVRAVVATSSASEAEGSDSVSRRASSGTTVVVGTGSIHSNAVLTCISFNRKKMVLACGTSDGRVLILQHRGGDKKSFEDDHWQFLGEVPVVSAHVSKSASDGSSQGTGVTSVLWGSTENLLGVTTEKQVSILFATRMKRAVSQSGLCVVQTETSELLLSDGGLIEVASSNHSFGPSIKVRSAPSRLVRLSCDMRIKGISVSKRFIATFDSRRVVIFSAEDQSTVATVSGRNNLISNAALHPTDEYAFILSGNCLEMWSFAGALVSTVPFSQDMEGVPVLLDVSASGHLVVVTDAGFAKVFKVSGREPKPIGMGRSLVSNGTNTKNDQRVDEANSAGDVMRVALNSKGNRVAFSRSRSSLVFVYDVEEDRIFSAAATVDAAAGSSSPSSVSSAGSITGDLLDALFWDMDDERVLTCQLSSGSVSLFLATSDCGIVCLDSMSPITQQISVFAGVCVPFLYFWSSGPLRGSGGSDFQVVRKVMRDFAGINDKLTTVDAWRNESETRKALLDFSFYLASGNMDEAFKAVRKLPSGGATQLWKNMAKMCVQTRRLDMAEMCVRRMGNAKAVMSIREAGAHGSADTVARLGALATELDMLDAAEKIYREGNRFDLLSKLLAVQGKWEEALSVAEKNDRIHLRTLHFQHGRYLESQGSYDKAIQAYEAAQSQAQQVPRMLISLDQIDRLQQYVAGRPDDQSLKKWFGAYSESIGDLKMALKAYTEAGDSLSAVRALCCQDQFDAAEQLVASKNDKAAAFYMGRYLESLLDSDEPGSEHYALVAQKAIHAYSSAGQYRQALELALRAEMDHDLMNIAVQGDSATQLEAAKYFEQRDDIDKAVILYQKAGFLSKALDMCFSHQLFDTLQRIVDDVLTKAGTGAAGDNDTRIDPKVLKKCADFFSSHGKFDRACALLVAAQAYDQALSLCHERNVMLTEELAERMTLQDKDDPRRVPLLQKIATICAAQGQYQLATKKFTQAGDKIRAMQVLLQTNDVEKIVFFANVAKQREIFMLAGNHLQNMDWRNDGNILKHIVALYSKAKAPEALAFFFDTCAQIEIDDFRDYDKAMDALQESSKYLAKARLNGKEARLDDLSRRISRVQKFLDARRAFKEDPKLMIQIAHQLLDEVQQDASRGQSGAEEGGSASVRLGDIFALLIEYYHAENLREPARDLIQQMVQRRMDLSYFLEPGIVETMAPDLVRSGATLGATPHSQKYSPLSKGSAAQAGAGGRRVMTDDDLNEENAQFQEEFIEDEPLDD